MSKHWKELLIAQILLGLFLTSSFGCSGSAGSVNVAAAEEESDEPGFTVMASSAATPPFLVTGNFKTWQTLEFSFQGPSSNENVPSPENPFLDYRLQITFSHTSGAVVTVPGFFDGDGNGGGTGDRWKIRWTPKNRGRWTGKISFRKGVDIAVSLDPNAGIPVAFDGLQGNLLIGPPDPSAPGFYGKGPLEYVGEHYLRHANGEYFLKGGADSPENFLGYKGFDQVQDQGGTIFPFIHSYDVSIGGGPTHVDDYQGDGPLFFSADTGVSSAGILGAINYLASQHVNSLYFLPMNLGGDGQETCPFVGYTKTPFNKTHYKIGRLHQWNQVFEHAMRKGIQLQFVLAEKEDPNQKWLDEGAFGTERRLFFRELVSRFGHLPAIKWNLCEENDLFSTSALIDMANYLAALDPFERPIAVHTFQDVFFDYNALVGNPAANAFTASSIQYGITQGSADVEQWRAATAAAGHKWVIDMDENGNGGLLVDNMVKLRKQILYDVLFSGGNIEWYCGYSDSVITGGDLNTENFRAREDMWRWTWYARKFMIENLPFWEMEPADALVNGENGFMGGAEVFAKPGEIYAVYLPNASPGGAIDLSQAPGTFTKRWYNPRMGLFEGVTTTVSGGGSVLLGAPPSDESNDWVLLVEKNP